MGSVTTNKTSDALIFFVNGKKVVEENPNPEWTLLHYLRNKLRLVGSKEGCGEGGCGACTVMQSRFDPLTKQITNGAVNACLTPLCSVHGTAIITVEGIGSTRVGLHPVQQRLALSHGTQCGFCSPGFTMSMYALLRNNPKPSEHEMEDAFQGNLCRCTGYRPIMEGFKSFCSKSKEESNQSNGCCMQNGTSNGLKCCKEKGYAVTSVQEIADVLFKESEFLPYDPTMDVIFPPELQLNDSLRNKPLAFIGENVTWYKPHSVQELVQLKKLYPNAKLVAGNTEIGVDVKFKRHVFQHFIQINEIPELTKINRKDDNSLNIGAALTLTEFEKFCQLETKKNPREGTVFKAIKEILHWFGGQQIRNVATVGGNVITASPISDLNPIFIAAGCTATFVSERGTRSVKIDEKFFHSYRSTLIQLDEILEYITIPDTSENEFIWAAKQARRREDDISIVTAAMKIKLDPATLIVQDSLLVYGGLAATTLVVKKSSQLLIGKKWERSLIQEVASSLSEDITLTPDAPGGMIAYRLSLAPSFFFKFFLEVSKWIASNKWDTSLAINSKELSAIEPITTGETKGVQLYQIVPKDQKVHDLVGRPVVHLSGIKHATGEAVYTDDVSPAHGELHGCFVLSTIAHGRILSIDASKALALPGVVLFMDAKSIEPSKNILGFVVDDEEIFASEYVTCQGQILGFIVAEDTITAEKASKLVQVKYEEKPAIVTMEQAIEQNSFYTSRKLQFGSPEEAFKSCGKTLEGEMRIGGQEHFYMETNCCIATPTEDREMDLLIGCQGVNYIQKQVARALGIPENRMKVRCRRMGGSFGGKESRSVLVALATCLAAQKLNLPVRTVMNRHDDMLATGGRNPFLCRYKVGYSKDGRISVVKATMYNNGGNSTDGSVNVMEKALMGFDSAYSLPNLDLEGFVCKTNLPSNTAFRGYGGPQASIFCENVFDAVAESVGKSPTEVRKMHLKQNGDMTAAGKKQENITLHKCWEECLTNSNYESRLKEVEKFNLENIWKKRGIAVMPMKHDVGFTASFMHQASALVMVFTDGSVSLNHGGTEMGQGLATKMVQVASRVLDIPADKIYHSESSTHLVANAIPTCGSMSSDLNGMAVIDACENLVKRLEPFKKSNPNGNWEQWVSAAYFNRVNLNATGYFEQGHVSYDFFNKENQKDPSSYSVFGVACSEVEIDVLTGDHSVLRVDIVIDAGESLNPAVDIGQIEGAFVQGYGLFCMEELLYSPKGHMLTRGPGMYKIPAMGDIPRQFYVSLLRGASNPKAVYSSKGLGEPPLFLSASIYFAIKEAIKSTRKENGVDTLFRLDCPSTAERIRLACPNQFTKLAPLTSDGKPSWAVTV